MAGEKSDVRILIAMSYRNSGICGHRDGRCDSRDNFEINSSCGQRFSFFAPASENKRIPCLQWDYILSDTRLFDYERVDFILRKRLLASALSGENDFGVNPRPAKHFRLGKRVVNNNVGALQQLFRTQCHQSEIARPRSDQKTFSLVTPALTSAHARAF